MTKRIPTLLILILLLVAVAIWIVIPNNPGINLGSLSKTIQFRLGLDLVGGVQALLEADLPATSAISSESMNTARQIVENRVNGLGVTEAVVQIAGDRRIVVELPGEKDPEKAIATIQQTGLLEFVDFSEVQDTEVFALQNGAQKISTDFGVSGQTTQTVSASSAITTPAKIYHTVMTGAELKNVVVQKDPQTGEYTIAFQLTSDGGKTFSDFTSANVGKILAIVLDKEIISAPRIQTAITDGQGVITGNFTQESANNLAIQLRYGSLPVPLKVATSQTVGPTLGQDSLNKSLIAGIIGLVVVAVFMAIYYRVPGLVADVALLIYVLFTLALFKFIPITMTLPGIAGFVLSIGVAVDANILIFERMREELRGGRTLRQAIDQGWSRAWPSIRDSNLSTLITCAILFWFGMTFGASIVKGFSLTLALGVLVSMFTAIIVTRTFLHVMLDNIEFKEHHKWFGV